MLQLTGLPQVTCAHHTSSESSQNPAHISITQDTHWGKVPSAVLILKDQVMVTWRLSQSHHHGQGEVGHIAHMS